MREILFRGKTLTGEWVFGDLVRIGATEDNGIVLFSENQKYCGIGIEITELYWYERKTVLTKTIGQYTGLTDKNGKKIFEGDIVKREYTLWHGETKKTRETQIGVVVYSNRDCGFQVEKKCNLRNPWNGDTIEVIGNIHDNPELLEGDNE